MQCYRTTQLNLQLLRQLARPGIVTLQLDGNAATSRYAVLVDMGEQTAILQMGGTRHTVSLSALARHWRGEFATFWSTPDGYNPAARGGATGPAITLLAQQLDKLYGVANPTLPGNALNVQKLDEPLKQRLRDFQRTRGLAIDGQPGPMTYMQLESALGSNTPRLPGATR